MTDFDTLHRLDGLITPAIGRALHDAAAVVPADQAIVEIGSYRGKSTAYLAAGAAAGAGAFVHAVDPWDTQPPPGTNGRDYYEFASPFTRWTFQRQLAEARVSDRVIPWIGYSTDVADQWADAEISGGPIGLLYVDGDHTDAGVTADWAAWSPHLATDATVIFDDYADDRNPGVRLAVDRIIALGQLDRIRTPIADRLLIAHITGYHTE